MNINLAYVEGISDTNTPSFVAIQSKDDFFLAHRVHVVELSYYAPRYEDTIRISTEIVGMESKFNYLYFTFGTRTYYYFIDNITYINADLIALHIRMDTITTYGSNIKILKGIVERKHINRWKYDSVKQKYVINRDYVRENFSEGKFLYKDIKNLTRYLYNAQDRSDHARDDTYGYIIVAMGDNNANTYGAEVRYIQSDSNLPGDVEIIPHSIYIFPIIRGWYGEYHYTRYLPESASTVYDLDAMLTVLMSNPATLWVRFVPGNFLRKEIRCVWDGTHPPEIYDIGSYTTWDAYKGIALLNDVTSYSGNPMIISPISTVVNIDTPTRNSAINTTYSRSYEVSTYCSDYVVHTFGQNEDYSYDEFYYYGNITIKRVTYFNGGNKFYIEAAEKLVDINDPTDSGSNWVEPYFVVADNSFYKENYNFLSLLNDNWQIYKEYNSYNMAAEYIKYAYSMVSSFVKNFGSAIANKFNGTIGGGNAFDNASKFVGDAFEKSHGLVNEWRNEGNAENAPDNIKQEGIYPQCLDDFGFYVKTKVVSDIDKCADMYRFYGNRISKSIINITDIYTYCNNRYYFNYLKFSNIDFILTYTINDETIMNDIRRRLLQGLTFFTVRKLSSSPSIYTDLTYNNYDNVENAFIS